MDEVGLISDHERFRVEALSAPEYAGTVTAALQPAEIVSLAATGCLNVNGIADVHGVGKPAILLLTNQRLLALRPRGKSVFGKAKERAPMSMPFGNIFRCSTRTDASYKLNVEICGPAPAGQVGPYSVWMLNVGAESAEGYGDVWRVAIMDLAEVAGGTRNCPRGL